MCLVTIGNTDSVTLGGIAASEPSVTFGPLTLSALSLALRSSALSFPCLDSTGLVSPHPHHTSSNLDSSGAILFLVKCGKAPSTTIVKDA
jgi:hypothetical protein